MSSSRIANGDSNVSIPSSNHILNYLRRVNVLVAAGLLFYTQLCQAAPPIGFDQRFVAKDTLSPNLEESEPVKSCIEGLIWKPSEFEVVVEPPPDASMAGLVRFSSPKPSGIDQNDRVALEWYAARNEQGETIDAPAVIVVHESGSQMEVGRIFAKAFHARGLHAFMIQLPYYGVRKPRGMKPNGKNFEATMKQGIADVRRARDAVASLPHIDKTNIAVQGTSLGGFVTATTAGIDRGFTSVQIMVAGGDLFGLITNGQREAGKLREMLAEAGYSGDKLRDLLEQVEPLKLAHRLDPKSTWMFSATRDQVVPPIHAAKLFEAAQLDNSHHIKLPADHYTGIIYVPIVVEQMSKAIRESKTTNAN